MYDEIRDTISNVIKENVPAAVLFSGGVDSSVILYEASKYNKDVIGITVGVKNKDNLDVLFSTSVANKMKVKHKVCLVSEKEIYDCIEEAIKIIETFNPEWISSTVTLLLGIKYAKKLGLKSISSGEGADDIFGSFPFFVNYKGDLKDLDYLIVKRVKEIKVMSNSIAESNNIRCISPFTNKKVCNVILGIPIEERMRKTKDIKTKYPLRMAYKGVLPDEAIVRPQTMAFSGSGVYSVLKMLENKISDEEFEEAKKKYFDFKNKLELYFFKIYKEYFGYRKYKTNNCVHCKSIIKKNSVNCRKCSTIQFKGKELEFNG